MSNKEAEIIIGNGKTPYSMASAMKYMRYNGIGSITTSEIHSTNGLSAQYKNNVWSDIKIAMEAHANILFSSLEEKTSNSQIESEWEDWNTCLSLNR
jgi:hypothetical protein